ncbi:SpoIIE family protein phosphatase [soil metagenome]
MSDTATTSHVLPSVIHVLLVEDNPADAQLLREVLKEVTSTKLKLTHVVSRTDALERHRAERFDVVLLDLGLPESVGLETFIYFHKHAPRVPTIVLSGLSDEEMAVSTVNRGAQDYLVKGRVDSDLLVRAIRYAIERKRVEEALRLQNEQLQEDLRLAREFQLALLPRKYPSFPGDSPLRFFHLYRPSSGVSGDFFDVFALSDTQAGVFICDVMGHGVRSALITALTRGLIEQHKPMAADPGRFLGVINDSLVNVLQQSGVTMFVTAFYMVVDISKSTVRFATAGHPSPLLLHRATATVERIYEGNEPTGAVLGLLPGATYRTIERPFSAGEGILLYTDGIREAASEEGEEFGRDRIVDVVREHLKPSTDDLLKNLTEAALEFSSSSSFEDDICLVEVEWAPKPG